MKFRVEVWEIQSYQLTVEAETEAKARDEAARMLQDATPENLGADYDDRWTDIMEAEAKT